MWQSTITRLAQETALSLSPSAMAAARVKDPRFYVKVRPGIKFLNSAAFFETRSLLVLFTTFLCWLLFTAAMY